MTNPPSINDSDIAIIGMSCRFPGARTIEEFWQNLKNGIESISVFSDEELLAEGIEPAILERPDYVKAGSVLSDIDQFDAGFFGFTPREAQTTDPQQRIFLECAWEALEDAGYTAGTDEYSIGVYAGVGMTSYLFAHVPDELPFLEAEAFSAFLGNDKDYLATRVSYKLDLKGPSVSVQTACSTSLVAAHMACQSLLNGECDMALAGGISARVPHRSGYFYHEAMVLSPDGHCRAFDADAQGTVPGNGAGVVVLKRLTDALADGDAVHAVIKGSAINNDGSGKVGFTVPSVEGQAAAISEAQAIADVEPESISYVEAHGTGTNLGDPIEIAALTQAFRQSTKRKGFCAIGSVKTNFGHTDAAAGVAGLIKTVLALKHRRIPPSLSFNRPNPNIDFAGSPFYVNATLAEWKSGEGPRRAGVSSFGIGGTNAHMVLEEAPVVEPEPPTTATEHPLHLLTLSAKTAGALGELAGNYAAHLEAHPETPFPDVCFTAATRRSYFEHRLALVAGSSEEAREQLRAKNYRVGETSRKTPKIAFLFTGQGSEYPDMGRQLFETEPLFRETIKRCDAILRDHGVPLLDLLYPDGPNPDLRLSEDMTWLQPVLFSLEYALARLWQSWGVVPDVVMGHSIGEYVAACIAGVFSLEDGLRLVANRGRLMQSCPEGRMLAVSVSEKKAIEIIAPFGEAVSVAVINAPDSVVLSGKPEAIESILAGLADEEAIETKLLPIPRASHSPLMEPALAEFGEVAQSVTYARPEIPLCSNVTGAMVTIDITSPEYWVRHLRQPVHFAASVQTLHEQGITTFLEIGPKPALLGMAGQCLPDDAPVISLPSLREDQEDWRQMLETLGQWHVHGGTLDWHTFDKGHARRKAQLPTYAFQRQRYWVDDVSGKKERALPVSKGSLFDLLQQGNTEQLIEKLNQTKRLSEEALPHLPEILEVLAKQYRKETMADTVEDWFYEVEWQPQALMSDGVIRSSGCWLIFADRGGLGQELAGRLEEMGNTCILAYASTSLGNPTDVANGWGEMSEPQQSGTIYHLDPANPADFQRFLREAFREETPPIEGIVHLWSLDAPDTAELTAEALTRAQTLSCGSVLHLVQAAVEQKQSAGLWLVTGNAVSVNSEPDSLAVAQAPLWGLGKVVAQEHPELWGGMIDDPTAAELLAEIGSEDAEDQVAYRNGQRYVARLVKSNPPPSDIHAPLNSENSYLITGGLGGLGLQVARWMVDKGARNLVLTGRSTPSEEALAVLSQLQETGAEVRVINADVSMEAEALRLFQEMDADMPPLKGIIHAAGVLDLESLSRQDWDRFRRGMAAKVEGSWHLHVLSRAMPLDFFVCFSSSSSLLGGLRTGSYVAANTFMDALADFRARQRLPALSINWGFWADGGMSAVAGSLMGSDNFKEFVLSSERGLQILDLLMGAPDVVRVGVLPGSLSRYLREFYPSRIPPFLFESSQDASAVVESISIKHQLEQATWEEYEGILVGFIRNKLANAIRTDPAQLDIEQPLSAMGVDSLMVVESRNGIRSELGIDIPMAKFMGEAGVVDLAREIAMQLDAQRMNADAAPSTLPTGAVVPGPKEQMLARLESGQLSEEETDALLNEYSQHD